ncbi:MAG: NAD(P)/FAD-dependent oxidoreductase [Thermomicrobiales bacterium]
MPETRKPLDSASSTAVIIGAGLAGLVAANDLAAAGWEVHVLDAEDRVGGRVRSTRTEEGFLLDRGFQVFLSAYPALRRRVDLEALDAKPFAAGASVWTGKRLVPLADPLRHPTAIVRDCSSPVFPLADKLRLARWAMDVRRAPWRSAAEAACESGVDRSALEALRARGFSDAFIDRFARPFWGGITLDRTLGVSEGVMDFTFKMFLEGSAVLPAQGMQAVPDALMATLPVRSIQTGTRAETLIETDGGVTGVRTAVGDLPADAVIVATDPSSARDLTGIDTIPADGVGSTTVFLAAPIGKETAALGTALVLDGTSGMRVNHIAPLSNVQPTYAPSGQALLAAVLLGEAWLDASDDAVAGAARDDVARMTGIPGLRVVGMERMPFSLFAQPPGIHRVLPDAITGTPGLVLAGDWTVDSSTNGAILSGEAAARAAINATIAHVVPKLGTPTVRQEA